MLREPTIHFSDESFSFDKPTISFSDFKEVENFKLDVVPKKFRTIVRGMMW